MIIDFDITDDGHHLAIAGSEVYAIITMSENDVTVLPLPGDEISLVSAEWMRSYAAAHGLPVTAEAILDELGVSYEAKD